MPGLVQDHLRTAHRVTVAGIKDRAGRIYRRHIRHHFVTFHIASGAINRHLKTGGQGIAGLTAQRTGFIQRLACRGITIEFLRLGGIRSGGALAAITVFIRAEYKRANAAEDTRIRRRLTHDYAQGVTGQGRLHRHDDQALTGGSTLQELPLSRGHVKL